MTPRERVYTVADDHLSLALFAGARAGDRRRIVNALAEGADPLALSAEGLAMDLCPPWAMDAWTALQRAGGLGLYDWLRGELALVDGECTVVLSAGMAAAILRDAAFRSMLGYLSTPADESDAAACMERVLGINRVIVKNGWETSSPLLSIFH